MTAQRFLFLQGPYSPFFAQLARALRAHGQHVVKVNFSVGDRLYWRLGDATHYRGDMANLPAFYATQYAQHSITDIVLFGDCRPVHRPAIALAKQQGLRVHVFEEGYFRSHWVTLEAGGVNGHSSLPQDPDWYRQHARDLPDIDHATAFASPFWQRAAFDVAYNLGACVNPMLHAGVQTHVADHPYKEYLGYLRRGATLHMQARQSQRLKARLMAESREQPFFLLPLQLASDAQIIHHSPFASMREAMLHVLDSFAQHAPAHTRLAVKLHPLDPRWTRA